MRTEELGPSLLAAFARVPDVRSRHGRRYPLPALLTLATAAMLAGARSLYAIVQWGQLQPGESQPSRRCTTPSSAWMCPPSRRCCRSGPPRRWVKPSGTWCSTARRCAASTGTKCPGYAWWRCTPRRPAWCWRKRGVRTSEEQALTADEQARAKQEAELSVAPRLLGQVRLAGRLVSGDALYCQRALCRQVRQAGGDYLFAIKENQPTLLDDVALLFSDPPPGERFLPAGTVSKHSGRLEERRLRASAALVTYLGEAGWVDVGLVLEVASVVRWPAQPARPARCDVRYFLTSLPPTTSAATALQAVRRHWQIENRLHWPRDVALGEDACRVRTGHAPQVLAALRNCVVGLLHQRHVPNLAAAVRTYAWSPISAVLSLLGLAPP